jgi:DNA-directed RNA polymerase
LSGLTAAIGRVSKWARPKPFCATPYGERVALEVFIDPLADFLAGNFPEKPQKAPTFLRPLIAGLNDYKKLALMGVAPLLDCMTWDRDDPSAEAKLKLRVGAEMEAQLPYIGPWTEERRLRAGAWLVSQALGLDLFAIVDGFPEISPKWLPELERLKDQMIRAHPVHMPLFEPPPDWTGFWMEFPDRLRAAFVRRDWWPEHRAAIVEAFKDPNWEHAKAVNALQRVPFKIDARMLALVERFGTDVMGHVYQQRWDDERTIADDIRTAKYIGERAFYIPRNCDKRGRIYSVCHFNFDRSDHVRSLFRFARGMNLDREEQTFWLEVHCANCHGETDKGSWRERINWVARNRQLIEKIAADPEGTFDLWRQTESPFCFVAACRELVAAWDDPENFQTHLPIGFDGSCNGLQHLALIARDPKTGYMVNVYPDSAGNWPNRPQDVYADVIAATIRLLEADDEQWARWWLRRFKDLGEKKARKLIKTPAMTYAYSATQGGMADQIRDVYDGSNQPAYDGARPAGRRDGCYYLAGKIIEACREVLQEPTGVMEYIQHLARLRAVLEWTTPSGFPVLNRYHEPKEPETINLKTYGVRVRHDIAIAFKDEIWRAKAINAAAANFVHSLDGAHLVKVVNAVGEILGAFIRDFITTHDCYYCLAPVATRFNRIIRHEMAGMYQRFDALVHLRNRNVGHDHSCSHACCAAPPRAVVPALIPPRYSDALEPGLVVFGEYPFG